MFNLVADGRDKTGHREMMRKQQMRTLLLLLIVGGTA
jgi:hypothetical protein